MLRAWLGAWKPGRQSGGTQAVPRGSNGCSEAEYAKVNGAAVRAWFMVHGYGRGAERCELGFRYALHLRSCQQVKVVMFGVSAAMGGEHMHQARTLAAGY